MAFLRFVLFCVFFTVGTTAFWIAVVADDLVQFYTIRARRDSAQQDVLRLQGAIEDHIVAIERIEADPNVTRRLAPVTFGTEPEGEDTVYPARRDGVVSAEKVLAKMHQKEPEVAVLPGWVERCKSTTGRIVLLLAGAGLIIIAFTCFGSTTPRQPEPEPEPDDQ